MGIPSLFYGLSILVLPVILPAWAFLAGSVADDPSSTTLVGQTILSSMRGRKTQHVGNVLTPGLGTMLSGRSGRKVEMTMSMIRMNL